MKAIESLRSAVRSYDEFECASSDAPLEEVIKSSYDYEKIKRNILSWAVIYIHELDRKE